MTTTRPAYAAPYAQTGAPAVQFTKECNVNDYRIDDHPPGSAALAGCLIVLAGAAVIVGGIAGGLGALVWWLRR